MHMIGFDCESHLITQGNGAPRLVCLSTYSPEQLCKVLNFAAGYLEGHMLRADHEIDDYTCATCTWVRETHSLLLID